MVSLLLLGPVDVPARAEGRGGQFGSPRLRCLLSALATRANSVADADWLAEILWPDSPPANPESALHNLVFRLRGELRGRAAENRLRVITAAPGYALMVDRAEVDSLLFADRVRDAGSLTDSDPAAAVEKVDAAESLWRGRPYGEFADQVWARADVEALDETRVRATEVAAEALIRSGCPSDAASRLAAIADQHPYRESLHLLLMQALWHADRPTDALSTYRALRQRLSTDLGTDPSRSVRDLHARVLAGEAAPAARGHRPRAPTAGQGPAIIGRTADLATLDDLLQSETVTTVVGPGGVGKTALIRHHTRNHEAVWFAELSGVQTAADVVHGVVTATATTPRRDLDPLDALTESLAARSGLLVLDNCEHVLDAAADLARAVHAGCPGVAVVATSRVPLGLDIEQVVDLEPLVVPPAAASDAEIAASPAVRLFCARARARDPRFTLTGDNVSAVAEVCRRLDGLPLGIELAATKARAIPPQALVDRLQWRFRVLHSPRSSDPRHRSLYALVDWSYGLLSDRGRRLFDTLSVFPARFGLDDAEDLAVRTGVLERADVTDTIAELVETSMLTVGPDGYRMLETLRTFGIAQLDEQKRLDAVRAAHAGLVADRLEPLGRELFGRGHVDAAALVATRLDDVRQAVDHACERDPRVGQRLLAGVIPYLELTMSTEVTGWARRLRSAAAADGPDAVVWAVAASGARFDGDLPTARRYAQTGLDRRPDPAVEVYLRMMLVEVGLFQGDLDRTATLAGQFRDAALAAGMSGAAHMADLCVMLMNAYRGDALVSHRAALRVADECDATGQAVVGAWARYCAGEAVLDTEPDRARALLEEAIAGAAGTGDRYLRGVAQVSRASIEARHGDAELAGRLLVDVVRHWRDAGNWTHQWVSLRTVVDVLLRRGHIEDAATLLGAIRHSDEITGAGAYGFDEQRLDAAFEQIRGGLGDDQFVDDLMARGGAMSGPEVVAAALAALNAE